MAVEELSALAGPFSPNGVTVEFPFDFRISSAAEVRVLNVTTAGVLTGEVSSSLYTVALAGDGEGGTITFTSAPDAATYPRLYVVADPDFDQDAVFSSTGPFNPSSLNDPLYHEAAKSLLLKHRQDRSLRFQDFNGAMPAIEAENFKGKRLSFNPSTADPEPAEPIADITRPEVEGLLDVISIPAYGSVAAAIAAAVTADKVVLVSEDTTVQIPTDAATLQIALDRLTPANNQVKIALNYETGHNPASGATLADGDWSQFQITSTDAEVTLDASFTTAQNFIYGTNAHLPTLACLINANSLCNRGYSPNFGGSGRVLAGCGVKNAWGTGLLAYNADFVIADDSVFTGCAVNGSTGAGITFWGTHGSAENADVSDSGYYGAQAAHGANVNFDGITADDATRHALRATDASFMSANNASATGSGVTAVRAISASMIVAQSGTFTGALDNALGAFDCAEIDARSANCSGATGAGALAEDGGKINVSSANCQRGGSPSASDIQVNDGGVIYATGATGGYNIPANTLTGRGVIYDDAQDDFYEEGTWTPAFDFATTGDLAVTYSAQLGAWIRVGDMVTLSFEIVTATSGFTHTTASGSLRIVGSPFTADEISGMSGLNSAGSISRYQGLNFTGSGTFHHLGIEIDDNDDFFTLFVSADALNDATIDESDVPTGGTVQLTGTITFRRG